MYAEWMNHFSLELTEEDIKQYEENKKCRKRIKIKNILLNRRER